MKHLSWIIFSLLFVTACSQGSKEEVKEEQQEVQNTKLKALIVDGQNNHYLWPKTTMMMKDYLEQTDLFEVDIQRMDSIWLGVKYNQSRPEPYTSFIENYPLDSAAHGISEDPVQTSQFSIDFSQYDLIVSNLGYKSAEWPEETKRNFDKYINDGGGLVIIHAANNVWGEWDEFNTMIGLGAWGGRDSTAGPYVYYNDAGELKIDDTMEGGCGSHGAEFEYLVTTRAPEHPIMKGLPAAWMHTQDELYERMRGPFENTTILATAYSDVEGNAPLYNPSAKGIGQHVPSLMAINYGQGRIFHSTLGHFDYSMECAGFITTLQRGAEWVATGEVTQDIPEDFPTEAASVSRKWE